MSSGKEKKERMIITSIPFLLSLFSFGFAIGTLLFIMKTEKQLEQWGIVINHNIWQEILIAIGFAAIVALGTFMVVTPFVIFVLPKLLGGE
jgi:uncharacterized membrane protein